MPADEVSASFGIAYSSASDEFLGPVLCNTSSMPIKIEPRPTNTVTEIDLNYNIKSLSSTVKNVYRPINDFNVISCNDEIQLMGPSSRWHAQPRSYKGAIRDGCSQRKFIRKIPSFIDITDGDTSGMGSSVDEPIESSTESASEASISAFQIPKSSSRTIASSPTLFKKRRGGWPKGTKRKPEQQGIKAPKPKAPVTAYILYLNDRRKYYKEAQSSLPYVEVFKLVGAEWSALPAEQKASYNARAEQEKKRYKSELQAYRQSPDYLLQLRKKRIKNTRKGETTTEESSDFTDEIDDDDSEELYCRICDQWFYSHHNKRVHLRGKLHGKAVMGEYQRERKAEELRQESSLEVSEMVSVSKHLKSVLSEIGCKEVKKTSLKVSLPMVEDNIKMVNGYDIKASESGNYTKSSVDILSTKYRYDCRGKNFDLASATEDEQEYDDAERDADEEYDGEEEITEEGGLGSDRVTDAAEDVLYRMIEREKEILWLRKRREKALYSNKKLSASLLGLGNRQKKLQEEKLRLLAEERLLAEKIQHYSSYFNQHCIVEPSNNAITYGSKPISFSTISILENEHVDPHDTERNNPWRIQCATSPCEVSGVTNNLKLKTKSLYCTVRPMEKITENDSRDINTQETNHTESVHICDPKKPGPRSLKLKMRFVKVKSLSSSTKVKKESPYVSQHTEYATTTSKSDDISCHGSPSVVMPDKCEQTFIDSVVSEEAGNIPNIGTKLTIGLGKNEGSSFSPCSRSNQSIFKCNLFANSTKCPISSQVHLNYNEFNLDSLSVKSNSMANFNSFVGSHVAIDKYPEKESLNHHIPFSTTFHWGQNIPSTSFSCFNTVKASPVDNISSFCFGSKHNDPKSSLIVASNIMKLPTFRDHDTDLLSSKVSNIYKIPNYDSFCEAPNKPSNVTDSIEDSNRDLSYAFDYNDCFEKGKSSPFSDVFIQLQPPSENNASDISQYNDFCESTKDLSANDSHIEEISLADCALNISSNFYDDKHLKLLNQPIICEETFFRQFGLDFDYQEHSKIINVDKRDDDVILQFPVTDDDFTALMDGPN